MCQLQFIKRYDGNLTRYDLNQFILLMRYGSISNCHAFGLFNNSTTFKKKGIINLKGFDFNQLLNDSFVCGHNRFMTTGTKKNNDNNHPFILDGFTLVHNGIISNTDELRTLYGIKSNIETDSYTILELFNIFFKQNNNPIRKKRVIESIKKTAECLRGSYSVFLNDSEGKTTYYFKNSSTSMSFYMLDNKVLIGSTEDINTEMVYNDILKGIKNYSDKKELKCKSGSIYAISQTDKLRQCGTFTPITETVTTYSGYGYSGYSGYYDGYNYLGQNFEDKEDLTDDIDEIFKTYMGYIPTYHINKTSDIITIPDSKEAHDVLLFIGHEYVNMFENKANLYIDDLFNYIGKMRKEWITESIKN